MIVQLAKVAARQTYRNIAAIRAANSDAGYDWFSVADMAMFHARCYDPVLAGQFFVTRDKGGPGDPDRFTARVCINGDIATVGDLLGYPTKADALCVAASYLGAWADSISGAQIFLRANGELEVLTWDVEPLVWTPDAPTGDAVTDMVAAIAWEHAKRLLPTIA